MSELICLSDSYMKECDATIQSIIDGKYLVLDRTIFYPRGGGQPADTGKIVTVSGQAFRVLNVMKKDGVVLHETEPTLQNPKHENQDPEFKTQDVILKTGDRVKCVLDWERRYKLMRMHTAAHVLAGSMNSRLGALITGNQLEEDKTRFDFDLDTFDRGIFDELVGSTNELLKQDVLLKIYSLPREEAMKIPGVVKLANALPPSITELRIVEIPGIDIQADGGTHVRTLKEVGQIEILKLENKGKTNRRVYFKLNQ